MVLIILCLSYKQKIKNVVLISPVPFTNFFEVVTKAKDNSSGIDVRVVNFFGSQMYIQKTTANSTLKLHTENWSSGIYFVEVSQGTRRKVVKVMKL